MSTLDLAIVAGYLIFALGAGAVMSRRAGRGLDDYFLSGRSLPWWLAGTSMVATTFAADTPLAITGLVAADGIAGNWLWWSLAIAHVAATLFYAPLWRRAGVLTDIELIPLRYSGRPARVLRTFRSLWDGVVINSIVLGWVILAMVKIMDAFFDLDRWVAATGLSGVISGRWFGILLCLIVALVYTILAGFWGVVVTDLVQFAMAMLGAVMLAVFAWRDVGGRDGLHAGLVDRFGDQAGSYLEYLPTGDTAGLPWTTFIAFLSVQWWASRNADSGSYLAQRMLASRTPRDSALATTWFTFAMYVLRSWPWIVVALVSLVVFPGLDDPEMGYPMMAMKYLPAGWLGLMAASLIAAFMSTVDTHINWGASLVVNDFLRPSLGEEWTGRKAVAVSRWVSLALMLIAGVVAYSMSSVAGAWRLLFGLSAGVGGVYIGRWLWWRVNAWSEIAAWAASAVTYLVSTQAAPEIAFGSRLFVVAGVSTAVWVTVTLLTRPVADATLDDFYRQVQPGSPWWGPVARRVERSERWWSWRDVGAWWLGVAMVYASLVAIGTALLEGWSAALPPLLIAATWGALFGLHLRSAFPAER